MASETGKTASGCVLCAWSLFVTTPLWLVILYQILSTIKATGFVWGLYFAYVPTCIIGIVLAAAFRLADGD